MNSKGNSYLNSQVQEAIKIIDESQMQMKIRKLMMKIKEFFVVLFLIAVKWNRKHFFIILYIF